MEGLTCWIIKFLSTQILHPLLWFHSTSICLVFLFPCGVLMLWTSHLSLEVKICGQIDIWKYLCEIICDKNMWKYTKDWKRLESLVVDIYSISVLCMFCLYILMQGCLKYIFFFLILIMIHCITVDYVKLTLHSTSGNIWLKSYLFYLWPRSQILGFRAENALLGKVTDYQNDHSRCQRSHLFILLGVSNTQLVVCMHACPCVCVCPCPSVCPSVVPGLLVKLIAEKRWSKAATY